MKKQRESSMEQIYQIDVEILTVYRLCWFVFPFLLAAIAIFLIWGDELAYGDRTCAVLQAVHIYCPGCGGTRAFDAFVHFHYLKSIRFNCAVPYGMVAYFVFMINTFLERRLQRRLIPKLSPFVLLYVGLGILLLQWVVRNVLLLAWGITYI